jgi:hypothetical protein
MNRRFPAATATLFFLAIVAGCSSSGSGTSPAASTSGGSSSGSSGSSSSSSSSSGGSDAASNVDGAPGGSCPSGVLGHCDPGATYPQYPGFTLALVEDFPAPVDLDNDPIFTWSDGGPQSGQTRLRKEQISFANGTMILTAESSCPWPQTACIPVGTSYAEPDYMSNTGMVPAMNVWGGEFRTKYNNYRYGRYEARYSAPSPNPSYQAYPDAGTNDGNFLSTMFVFRTPKWLTWNEVDVELEPSGPLATEYNVINAVGATNYQPNNAAPGSTPNPVPGYQNNAMHTYAFEWTPTNIVWYVDGTMIHQFAGTANVPIPSKSAKIMMNLWVFGKMGAPFGDSTKNVYPFSATYDYFRFYKWDQETTYPCSPTPSCLSAADTLYSQNNPNEPNYPN